MADAKMKFCSGFFPNLSWTFSE